MGDWDRHEGQYFWAVTENEGKTVFRSFQLDHDGAFFVMTSLLPSMATRIRPLRKFQHFGEEIREVNGLNEQSRFMDEVFLSELEQDEWLEVAKEFKDRITDEVLEEAVSKLPKVLDGGSNDEILSRLKVRRDDIVDYAMEYYKTIAANVDILGTVSNNTFRVTEKEYNRYRLVMESSDNGEVLFDRLIKAGETRSVRLFAMGGDNHFVFTLNDDLPFVVHIVENDEGSNNTEFVGSYRPKNIRFHGEKPYWREILEFKYNTREFSTELMEEYRYNYQEADDDLFGSSN